MRSVASTLAAAQWGRYLVLMVPYSVFYFLVDTFVVQQAVSWFNVPVAYRDVLPVRATTYILSLVNTQLGQGGLALYLHRRHGLPFWEITGTVVFLSFVEVYQLAFYSFIGALVGGELGRGAPVWVYAGLAAYLAFHLWFFSRPRGGRIGRARVLATFYQARPSHYLRVLLYKTPNLLAAVTVHFPAPRLLLRRPADRRGAPGTEPGGVGVLLPELRTRGRPRRLQPGGALRVHADERAHRTSLPAEGDRGDV